MAAFCGTNVPLRRKIPFYEARFPAQCTVPHHASSQTIGPARDCLPTCDTNGICVPTCASTSTSSPSIVQDPIVALLPDIVRSATEQGSDDPEYNALAAATDARSAAFCARCKHSSRLPADAAAPSMMAATAIKATPDMVPEPSSDPRIQANQCFTRRFTLPIPFRHASIKWLPIVFHNMFHTSYVASSKPHRPPCTGHNQQSRISLRRDQHASEQR